MVVSALRQEAESDMTRLPLNQILCGNCVDVLEDFPENSIDLVVTDPPYGLSFMGKDWDKTLPPREAFEEIIRVLKPGALAFVMSSPRQDLLWRMLAMLEGVGFELTQSYIDWIYKTGFPKAYDVSKGIDKKFGRLNVSAINLKNKLNALRIKKGYSKNKMNKLCGFEASNFFRTDNHLIDVFPKGEKWKKITSILGDCSDLEQELERLYEEAEREVVDIKKNERNIPLPNRYDGTRIDLDITAPSTPLAEKWDGWKSQTGLKPAHEPILMVRKPLSEGTIVDNVLRWGTGAINVDACRIPFQTNEDRNETEHKNRHLDFNSGTRKNRVYGKDERPRSDQGNYDSFKGRFPANLLVSDEALDLVGRQDKGGGHTPKRGDTGGLYEGGFGVINREERHFTTGGGPSRYFDLDAWAEHHGFLDVPKPDNKERDFGLTGAKRIPTSKLNLGDGKNPVRLDGAISTPRRNIHPTVKPIKLMAYLIELGCPPDGVVLDPFVGSGTTCIAAKQLVRKFIGIELNPEYHALAESRVKSHPVPLSWFDGSAKVEP